MDAIEQNKHFSVNAAKVPSELSPKLCAYLEEIPITAVAGLKNPSSD